MKAFLFFLLLGVSGCSNAPLASTMDWISPGRVRPERNLKQDRGPTPPNIPPVETDPAIPPRPRVRIDTEPVSPTPPRGRSDDTSLPPLPPTPTDRE